MDDSYPTTEKPLDSENEVVGLERLAANANKRPSMLRSFTRLLVGGILTGMDGFSNRMLAWEDRVTSSKEDVATFETSQPTFTLLNDTLTNEFPSSGSITSDEQAHSETAMERLRYAMVGMVFDTQERIEKSVKTAGRLTRAVEVFAKPLIEPIQHSRLLSPARDRFNRLVDRGELQVQRWIDTGRREEIYSRKLADIALYDTVDFWIDYFAESPEVVDLVTSQSVSFAEEVVEEVRERTVSADNLLEGLVRTVFRLPLRVELPPPPPEVQKEAKHVRRQVRKV